MPQVAETTRTDFLKFMEDGLTQTTRERTGLPRVPVLFVLTRDDGTVAGGIKAHRVGHHFFVGHLYVDETLRGQGWGRALMRAAEDAARGAGCTRIFVDTLSFQAPDFYKAIGYGEVARMTEFYPGHDRIFFEKQL